MCFQQTVGIQMGTNCALLLADLFLYYYMYEEHFIQRLLKKNGKKLNRSVNFTFRYIDDVLWLNHCKFGDFVDHIYPTELEIKDTTDTARSVWYIDLHPEINNEGWLIAKLEDKRDYFNYPVVNFPLIYVVLTFQQPLHMEYISLSYQYFLDRRLLLTKKPTVHRGWVEVITSKVLP